jgi:hypothetical protein
LAPRARRSRATSARPSVAAWMSAVRPVQSLASMSAPASRKRTTRAHDPPSMALIGGVARCPVEGFTEAPSRRSRLAMRSWLPRAAAASGRHRTSSTDWGLRLGRAAAPPRCLVPRWPRGEAPGNPCDPLAADRRPPPTAAGFRQGRRPSRTLPARPLHGSLAPAGGTRQRPDPPAPPAPVLPRGPGLAGAADRRGRAPPGRPPPAVWPSEGPPHASQVPPGPPFAPSLRRADGPTVLPRPDPAIGQPSHDSSVPLFHPPNHPYL